jgi:hypothetical protein
MIPLILGLLPVVPHIVLGVEHLFGKGGGVNKKQAAMSALADMINILSKTQATPGADSSTMNFLDDLVEATVKYFNANGTLTHGGK